MLFFCFRSNPVSRLFLSGIASASRQQSGEGSDLNNEPAGDLLWILQ
jgi:hypothetical protein